MSHDYNKPKNMNELGDSFEEHLKRQGRVAKKVAPTVPVYNYGNNSRSVAQHSTNQPPRTSSGFSVQAEERMKRFENKEQTGQIFRVWAMLLAAFGSKLTHFFGDEPDSTFMAFAASLTPDGYKRLEANLYERLDEDKEWPPSIVRLSQLADSPTKEAMYNARQRLFHNPVPTNELDRVEKYVKRYKMSEVRNFSDQYFESDFNRRYTQWFREVVLQNMDERLAEREQTISDSIESLNPTVHDKRVDDEIESGKAFDNKYGARILEMLKGDPAEFEEIDEQDQVALEQRKLAKQIFDSTEND